MSEMFSLISYNHLGFGLTCLVLELVNSMFTFEPLEDPQQTVKFGASVGMLETIGTWLKHQWHHRNLSKYEMVPGTCTNVE